MTTNGIGILLLLWELDPGNSNSYLMYAVHTVTL